MSATPLIYVLDTNVCKQFGVEYIDPFAMLTELKTRFILQR